MCTYQLGSHCVAASTNCKCPRSDCLPANITQLLKYSLNTTSSLCSLGNISTSLGPNGRRAVSIL